MGAPVGGRVLPLQLERGAGPVEVRPPAGVEEWEAYFDLRWRVLRGPWHSERGQERDEREPEAIHLALWVGGQLVAVGRAHFLDAGTAQIRYMAVEPEWQGQGWGGRLLEQLEAAAVRAGARRLVLNARERARNFYRRHGYRVTGEAEPVFGRIRHWAMAKAAGPGRGSRPGIGNTDQIFP